MTEQSLVPIWPHFVPHVLTVLSGGTVMRRRELIERVMDTAELSQAARSETIAAGDGRAENRIGWALSNLFKAGWIDRPQRATYRITEVGHQWLKNNSNVTLGFSDAHRLFKEFWPHEGNDTNQQAEYSTAVIEDSETEYSRF